MAEQTMADIQAEMKKKGVLPDEQEDQVDEEEVEVVEDEAEEVEIDNSESEDVDEDDSDAGELTEDEQQAISAGWKPKDEWDGDPEDWVPARQFNKQGELFNKIHNQNRQLKHLNTVVDNLVKQHKQIFEAGYEKAKKELKAGIRQATKDDDDATAEALEEQLEKLEQRKTEDIKKLEPSSDDAPQVAPEFAGWVTRNDWFLKHPEMRAYAEMIGVKYAQEHPTAPNTEVYTHVTENVKKRFPERFGMTTKKIVKKSGSPVEGNGSLSSNRQSSQSTARVTLTPEEKAVGRVLVQRGLYKNLNEYATNLKKLGVKA